MASFSGDDMVLLEATDFKLFLQFSILYLEKILAQKTNFITALKTFGGRNEYWHSLMPPPKVIP